jgi:hypothetical protein
MSGADLPIMEATMNTIPSNQIDGCGYCGDPMCAISECCDIAACECRCAKREDDILPCGCPSGDCGCQPGDDTTLTL